jgi:ABC-type branched-subunit amino acid transport system permease subunit
VSIILLGGIGNLWGVAVAAAFVVILPEKFQVIQEYRFMLYAVLVILILLFRPQGLLPRGLREHVPGRKLPSFDPAAGTAPASGEGGAP